MKVHHFILYLVVSCLFCIEASRFIMKHRNIHLYHSLKSGNIQYCESNNAQFCSFNLFPTLRFPPAWNPSLERRKLMILTGSKLQPTLCRKFALHWKQLNLNHTFHWKAKPFRTQIGLQSRIKLIFDQGGLQRVSTCHWETPLLTSQYESSEFLQLITIAFICHQRHQ